MVHVVPNDLDWGQIPVLNDISKTIRLSNESLIAARFTTQLVGLLFVLSCYEVKVVLSLRLT